jgi:predicted restriction endonuclease
MNRYQIAAKVSNDKRRANALENYYKNPVKCQECGRIIEVKENEMCSQVRKRKFCGKSCSVKFNNKVSPKRKKKERQKIEKKQVFDYLNGVRKKEFFEIKGIYYKFRAVIRKHAHYIYNSNNGEKKCKVCGYDKHVEVCHIKSVSSFGDEDLITEINSFDNLIGLCPNHHWEFDNGHINIL